MGASERLLHVPADEVNYMQSVVDGADDIAALCRAGVIVFNGEAETESENAVSQLAGLDLAPNYGGQESRRSSFLGDCRTRASKGSLLHQMLTVQHPITRWFLLE